MTDIEDLEKLLEGLIKKPLHDTLTPALEGVRKKIEGNLEECFDPLRSEQEELASALKAVSKAADANAKTIAAALATLQTSLNATASEQEELAKALTLAARTADTNAQVITAALTSLQTALNATTSQLDERLLAIEKRANADTETCRQQARIGLLCTIAAAPFAALLVILLEILTRH